MKHHASSRFRQCLDLLPRDIQELARKNYALLKRDPAHPSLQFKTVGRGRYFSARVGIHYRALGIPVPDGVLWFWVGSHAEYDKLLA